MNIDIRIGKVRPDDPRPVIALRDRWLRFDPENKRGLVILAGTQIKKANGSMIAYDEDTQVDLTEDLGTAGADYGVYLANDGTISAAVLAGSAPADSIKIGRFHTLCVSVGTPNMIVPASPSSGLAAGGKYLIKPYGQEEDPDFYALYNKTIVSVSVQSAYDLVTVPHILSGWTAGDILPESIFCTGFEPDTMFEDAMVYDRAYDRVIDIYLQSGTGQNTRSRYNAAHTVSRTAFNHMDDMRCVGKELLSDGEFTSAALGSNEKTAITGSSDKTYVGGHVDTSNRRMISAIGCEEMCGYLTQWLREPASNGGSGWVTTDTHASFGQEYGDPYVLHAGGYWSNSSSCGSRCRVSNARRSGVYGSIGGRGSSRVKRRA